MERIGNTIVHKRLSVDKRECFTAKGRRYTKTIIWVDTECVFCGSRKEMTLENVYKRLRNKTTRCSLCNQGQLEKLERNKPEETIFNPPINLAWHNQFISSPR